MRTGWTHELCEIHAIEILGDRYLTVVTFKDDTPQICCVCGVENTTGIYYRAEPGMKHCVEGHKRA